MRIALYSIAFLSFFFTACDEQGSGLQTHMALGQKQSRGEMLFEDKCSLCHAVEPPKCENRFPENGPDMEMVTRSIKAKYTDVAGDFDEDAARKFVVDYVFQPHETKAILMDNATEKYGIMPSLKGSVTEEEVEHIMDFLLEKYPSYNK
jgi:cytochrome c2